MTGAELKELRGRLEQEREGISQALGGVLEAGRPVSLDDPIGRLSRMDAMQQQAMAKAQHKLMVEQLDAIELALSRMAEGEFGECLRCGEEIAIARLRVRPTATLCVGCQGAREG